MLSETENEQPKSNFWPIFWQVAISFMILYVLLSWTTPKSLGVPIHPEEVFSPVFCAGWGAITAILYWRKNCQAFLYALLIAPWCILFLLGFLVIFSVDSGSFLSRIYSISQVLIWTAGVDSWSLLSRTYYAPVGFGVCLVAFFYKKEYRLFWLLIIGVLSEVAWFLWNSKQ